MADDNVIPISPMVDITKMLRTENDKLMEKKELSTLEGISTNVKKINVTVGDILKQLRGDKLEKEEERRDEKSKVKPSNKNEKRIPDEKTGFDGWFWISALVAGAAGLVTGFGEGFKKFITIPLRLLNATIKTIGNDIKESRFAKSLDSLKKTIKSSRIFTMFDNMSARFLSFSNNIQDFFKKRFSRTSKLFTTISKSISKLPGMIKTFFAPVAGFFKSFRLLGRLFYPFTILISLWDGVMGFIKGFEREGTMFERILGGVFGGVREIVKGLIFLPLDLLKKGVSWILDKLGADTVSKWLDSFSFVSIFEKLYSIAESSVFAIVDALGGWFDSLVDGWNSEDLFGSALESFRGWFVNLPKKMFGLIKSGISNIFSFIGKDKWANAIKGFKFGDLISRVGDSIRDGFIGLLRGIVEKLPGFITDRLPDDLREWLQMDSPDIVERDKKRVELIEKRDDINQKLQDPGLNNRKRKSLRSSLRNINEDLAELQPVLPPSINVRSSMGKQLEEGTREKTQVGSPSFNVVTDARTQNNISNSTTAAIINQNMPTDNNLDTPVT